MIHLTYNLSAIPPSDLLAWGQEGTDWQATIDQPHIHLITDSEGCWCLVERLCATLVEVHIIVRKDRRGRHAIAAARQMIEWVETNLPHQTLIAKTKDRATELFLRWLGFRYSHEIEWNGSKNAVYHLIP